MPHLDNQSIDRGIFRCEPQKAVVEPEHAVQIVGRLPFGLWQGEIWHSRRGPRRVDQLGGAGEEGLREASKRVAFVSKQSAEQHRLLRSHAHPLTPYRIEAADRIADR